MQASELFYGFNSMNPMLRGVRLVVGFQRCETPTSGLPKQRLAELYGHEANTFVVRRGAHEDSIKQPSRVRAYMLVSMRP